MATEDSKVRVKKQPVADRFVSIVDDDASVRRSTGRLIRSLGLQAETFASADDFLSSGRADQTACLLLDVRMPGMDGLELQRRLADRTPSIPIVFLTARASDDEKRRALEGGAVDFLRKPVSRETLLRVLGTIFDFDSAPRGQGGHHDD
jgi:FixJ family two-component response regulator